MSGQYPGGYNNPLAGHRGQFNPQQQQQQQQQQIMNQMQMGSANAGGMMAAAGSGPGGGMMAMGGGAAYGQGGMMSQQGNPMQQGIQGMAGSVGAGNMGPSVMNSVGMQSPSHVQQQLMQQQQIQQQQMGGGPMGPQMGMGMGGHVGIGGSGVTGGVNPQVSNIMPQQQQMTPQMQQNVGMQQAHQMQAGPSSASMGMLAQQQQSMQQPQQSPVPQQPQQTVTQSQQMPQTTVQQQMQQQPQPSSNNVLAISQQPHKEINIVTLSRVGQETVQDITSRFQEIFTALKVIQPTGSRDNGTVKKVQEHFRTIRLLFKRMRLIYERCSDGYPQGMEYTHVESLIPYKDEAEHRNLEGTQCEEYRKALQENQELIDTVKLKNRQLREIIDRTRIIVWEINTMLSMRRS